MIEEKDIVMEATEFFNTSQSAHGLEPSSPTEAAKKFDLEHYLLKSNIIIIIPSVFLCIFFIILFIIIIRKIINRHRFDPKQLETYASIIYDEESIDEELGNAEDLMYTSCKLLVGGDYEDSSELTNSEPEYDCMSVDVSIRPNESSIVDFNQSKTSQRATQDPTSSSKTLPRNFWKR